tara:strand:- start:718 stop:1065 length:348 start_codon:yes stop_codon:yes gene_type:complete
MKGYSRYMFSIIILLFFIIAFSTIFKGKYHEGMKDDDASLFAKEKKNVSCVKDPRMEFMTEILCSTYDGDADKATEWFKLAEGCLKNIEKNDKLKEHNDKLKERYDKFHEDKFHE